MKQVLQDLKNGDTFLVNTPLPIVNKNDVLISTHKSLISVGTEKMLVNFGKANLVEKALQQPDKVKMVIDKIRTDGVLSTVSALNSKLSQPIPLGYSNVGRVIDIGSNVTHVSIGDRVVSNGSHADIVRVNKNLCAKVPKNVTDQQAAFTVPASIGLQGVRLAAPTLGECFVVIGAGLIGLLTIQLLIANGCRVLAVDFDEDKLKLAAKFGAESFNANNSEELISTALRFSRSNGVDGVIITASTTSSDPISQAANISRKRGRIILVGVTGLTLNRAEFYEKELTFQVSCSYGPGRYDSSYEVDGNDYPIGFVRWTEQRNFEAILDMIATNKVDPSPIVSHSFKLDEVVKAYDTLTTSPAPLGVILEYQSKKELETKTKVEITPSKILSSESCDNVTIGLIGAGNYSSRVFIPALAKTPALLHTLVSSGGTNSVIHGKKFGFNLASTSVDDIFDEADINTVAITTRHNSHANFVIQSLNSGKHTFVEKPLALTHTELEDIKKAYEAAKIKVPHLQLMVGFNRRFSPLVVKMKSLLENVNAPKSFIFTVNSGSLPPSHWTQDIQVGGGRIIGEACHFVDLMRHLSSSKITSVQATKMYDSSIPSYIEDVATLNITFADGSFGSIHYLANGSSSYPKERLEVFTSGKILQIDNFRKLKGYGWKGFKSTTLWKQNKGHNECISSFITSIKANKAALIPFDELYEVSKFTIDAAAQLRDK
ncbi:bi-domain-containing oxidoreductase [Flocculibacter collagenilyticus]|uniref:bi-domain-containing oxidoreductase n=1 Tax=Flocculibacter collagenilyticus TaxID=2744479 RepID=UPI0018F77393|nr:bi-domain-containing oxidoreductase [Flocculibacter collagenilyticus]